MINQRSAQGNEAKQEFVNPRVYAQTRRDTNENKRRVQSIKAKQGFVNTRVCAQTLETHIET